MAVTAKQIAQQLNISEAAVSLALNDRPGVSVHTKKRILDAAKSLGYDFSRIASAQRKTGTICFLMFDKYSSFERPFFTQLIDGVQSVFKNSGYRLVISRVYNTDEAQEELYTLRASGCSGIILLATEMEKEDFFPFTTFHCPIVVLDSSIDFSAMDCVHINNVDGACQATEFLIKTCHEQPGYLHGLYPLNNFEERADGFYKAIRKNGFSANRTIVHNVSATIDGAYSDVLALLDNDEPVASCYFADNDEIAIGAIRAFKEKGYRVPEDVSIVGFDNIPFSTYVDPPLTSVNVPSAYMGHLAAKRILATIDEKGHHPVKIAVNAYLIERSSVAPKGNSS